MSNYQIPKLKIDVKLALLDEEIESGCVFLTETYRGEATLESFLNHEGERFFPFRQEEGQVRLINKNNVVYLETDETEPVEKELLSSPIGIEVVINQNMRVKGLIYSNLPADTLRVSDYINQDDRFLAIYAESGKYIVNMDRVLYVLD